MKDMSMARQILRSWVGRKLLDEISDVKKAYEKLVDAKDFDWSFVPKLD